MKLLSITSAEKIRTETCLVGSKTKIIPNKLYYGFMRYTIREHTSNQEFVHDVEYTKEREDARCGEDHEYGKWGEGVKPKYCFQFTLSECQWITIHKTKHVTTNSCPVPHM